MSSSSLLGSGVNNLFARGLQTRTRTLQSSGPVRAVDEANASGCSLTLVDSTGVGSDEQIWTITGAGGPPITSATMTLFVPIQHVAGQAGLATIPLGATSIQVANTAITANSVVVFSPTTAPDATLLPQTLRVTNQAGVGFTITGTAPAVATAAVPLNYWIARY